VVIGTPVWAGSVSAPTRAWLATNLAHLHRVAFFCTLRGRGSESAFAQMGSLAGRQPVARCAITTHETRLGEESRLLDVFTRRLERKLAQLEEMEWLV
jgi:multimeric flavodoxin WrbA